MRIVLTEEEEEEEESGALSTLGDDGSGETGVTQTGVTVSGIRSSNGNSDGSRDCDLRDTVVVDGLSVVGLRNGHWVRDALVDGLVSLNSLLRADVSVLGGQVGHAAEKRSAQTKVQSRANGEDGANNQSLKKHFKIKI